MRTSKQTRQHRPSCLRELCLAALAAALLTDQCKAQVPPEAAPYAVFELPSLGGVSSYGWTLDESGNVVGSATLPNRDFHPTLWVDGQRAVDLGTFGGPDGSSRGINNNGWIVGRAKTIDQGTFDFSAFLWRNGEMMNLGNLGGTFAEAYGVNEHNQIVGWSELDDSGDSPRHAFLWEDGVMSELPISGDYQSSEAIAINNSGLIVGQASSYTFDTWRPVIWQDGQIIDLGTLRPDNGGNGVAIDCNEAGDVVGYAKRDFFSDRGVLYHNGHMYALPEQRDCRSSAAWSINNQRQIVGGCEVRSLPGESTGSIWEWGKNVQYLGEMIPPHSNWHIGLAIHNNDAGQITGTGYRLDDPDHTKGYLLTPVHQTMELGEVLPGLAGELNTLTVTGAAPGARVVFLYSRRGGGTAIPGCTLQTNCLQLDRPKLIGSATADAEGHASITAMVPLIARGHGALFQAVVQGECAISQLVVHQFE